MANCLNYDCSDPLGDHVLNDCGEELQAGGSGMVLLDCSNQLTDPSDATQILAEIAAGRAWLVDNVKIGLNEAEAVQIDSNIVGATQKLVTYNRSGTMLDGNVSPANNDFYDGLYSGRTFGGAIIYIKGTEDSAGGALVTYIDAPLTFTGSLPIQNNNDQNMVYTSTFNWRQKPMPGLYPAPVGIFV